MIQINKPGINLIFASLNGFHFHKQTSEESDSQSDEVR